MIVLIPSTLDGIEAYPTDRVFHKFLANPIRETREFLHCDGRILLNGFPGLADRRLHRVSEGNINHEVLRMLKQAILSGLLLLGSCSVAVAAESAKSGVYQPTIAELKNRTYRVPGFKDDRFFNLIDGWSCLGEQSVHLDTVILSDLNADGLTDAVVVLTYNGGGSATLKELYVLVNDGKRLYQSCNGYSLFNTQIQSIVPGTKEISLKYLAQKENDPNLAPPTVRKSVQLKLNLPYLSSLKPQPQKYAERFQKIVSRLDKVLAAEWQSQRHEWKQYEEMSEQDFKDRFALVRGPRKDITTRPKWQVPSKGTPPVVIDFTLDEAGCLVDLQLTRASGVQIFDQTALSAVASADFEPAVHSDSSLTQDVSNMKLHVRATFTLPIRCEIPEMTMPSLGKVIPEVN